MVSTIERGRTRLPAGCLRACLGVYQARLCIAGRIGYKCEALVEQVRQHPELNNACSCSTTSPTTRAWSTHTSMPHPLVLPSLVEGFGLPLVEAMRRGPAGDGQDIPVFREIGGEFMATSTSPIPRP